MTRTLLLTSVLALLACDGKGSDSDSGSTTTVPDPCLGKTVVAFPAANATEVYYRTTIEFTMSEIESDATISVDGVTGQQSIVNDRVVFTPDSPLSASTTYNVNLDWSCGPTATSFTTSNVGDPATPADLVGKTYSLDIGTGRFVEPEGIGSLVAGLLETPLWIGVTAADAATVHFASVPSSTTDICADLNDFPTDADFAENPYFSVSTPGINLDIQDVIVGLQDSTVTGAFSANGDRIAGVSLAGTLDVSPLGDVVGSDPCKALAGVGAECIPCPDGLSSSCLSVVVDGMTASEVAGTSLVCP